jgi:hypothetical protein
VLNLKAAGFRNKAIALSLSIADKTVELHIQNICAENGEPAKAIQPWAHPVPLPDKQLRRGLGSSDTEPRRRSPQGPATCASSPESPQVAVRPHTSDACRIS